MFEDLIDQEIVKQTLQNEIKGGKLAHAYLFSGPRGLGKTTTARLLAKAVNCQKRKSNAFEPCNTCDSCQAIIGNRSLDLIEIDAASNRGINEIRQLKEHIGFTPAGSNYRVFIIDEVHMLTPEAFNALLKTLEEPPTHAIFILATTELHKVPDTVISRCQTFTFRRVDEDHLKKRLQKIAKSEGVLVDDVVLGHIAHLSGGFIRDAESMLGQLLSLGEKKVDQNIAKLVLPTSNVDYVVKFLTFVQTAQITEALTHINNLVDQGADLEYFSKELLESLRQLLVGEYGSVEHIDEHLRGLQGKFGVRQLLQLINLVDNALREIKRAEIPQLPLELVVVEYIESNKPESSNDDDNSTPPPVVEREQPVSSEDSKDEAKPKIKDTGKLSFKQIQKQWPDVVAASKTHNHSLPMTLNVVHLLDYHKEDNTLEMGFEHELHVVRVNSIKVQELLRPIFKEIFGTEIISKARVLKPAEIKEVHEKNSKKEHDQEEKLVNEMLDTFGGVLEAE